MRRWCVGAAALVAMLAAVMCVGAGEAAAVEATAGGWYWQNPGTQGNSFHDVAVTSAGAIAVGDAGAVYVSADGGATWRRRTSGVKYRLWAADFVDASRGWAVGYKERAGTGGADDTGGMAYKGGIIATTNGGASWMEQTRSEGYRFTGVSFANANAGWACGSYAVPAGGTSSRILRTTNGGGTWTVAKEWKDAGSKDLIQVLMQIDFVNANTGWATGWGYDAAASGNKWGYVVLKTTDGGDTWAISRFGDGRAKITAMDFTNVGEGWLATASLADYAPATIWKTTDGGATWAAVATKEAATITDLAVSGPDCYAAGRTQGEPDWLGFVLHSSDGGTSWAQEYAESTAKLEAVGSASGSAVAVGGSGFFLRREAGSGTWLQSSVGSHKNLTNVQFFNESLGWAVGSNSTILRTTNGGRQWNATSVPSKISIQGIDMVTDRIGWAVGCSGPHVPNRDMDAGYGTVILRTTDGGLTWKYQRDRTSSPGLAGVDFTDVKHGWVVGGNGMVMRTSNGGKTWWPWTIGSDTLRDVKFVDALHGFVVGGDTGSVTSTGAIWCTSDGGRTWTQPTTDRPFNAPMRAIQARTSDTGTLLTATGDDFQIYESADGGASWGYVVERSFVVQGPPFHHFMDIGFTELVSATDTTAWALGESGEIWSLIDTLWTPDVVPTESHVSNHSGGSGTDNQLTGISVVNADNAWAVGEGGTILSFDRQPPVTTFAPANAWLQTPLLALSSTDPKSGVAAIRWVVDPDESQNWDTAWAWQFGTSATFSTAGDAPGTKHVIYYQAVDVTGNLELDPFWLGQPDPHYKEVPRHVWVTVDAIGPQTYAPAASAVRRGQRPSFTFWVNDDLSTKAKVSIVVKDSGNETVKVVQLGWLTTSQQFSAPISTWKCTLPRGTYSFSVQAEDQAGNNQAVLGSNTLTVN